MTGVNVLVIRNRASHRSKAIKLRLCMHVSVIARNELLTNGRAGKLELKNRTPIDTYAPYPEIAGKY